jgi:hypothetical protein
MPPIRTVLLAILLGCFQTNFSWAAGMALVYGPGDTSIVIDPGCTVRDGRVEDSSHHASTRMWIDCRIEERQITLMISALPDIRLSEDFYDYKRAGVIFALITVGTEWSRYKDRLQFEGAQSSNHFAPFAWLKSIAWLCPSASACSFPPEKIFELKLLGTASRTVSLLAFGDTVESEVTYGNIKGTKAYFPDPIAAMIGSFHFETLRELPY